MRAGFGHREHLAQRILNRNPATRDLLIDQAIAAATGDEY